MRSDEGDSSCISEPCCSFFFVFQQSTHTDHRKQQRVGEGAARAASLRTSPDYHSISDLQAPSYGDPHTLPTPSTTRNPTESDCASKARSRSVQMKTFLKMLTFVVLLLTPTCFADSDFSEDVGLGYVDTTALTEILDRLTNKTVYDKRLRPRYGDKPVDVGITIHVSSISAVSEVDMDFTLDFYMRQNWQDPRLTFKPLEIGNGREIRSLTSSRQTRSLQVGVDYLDKLWKPDTFFPNEKKSFFHTATTHNSFLRIDSDGTVATSQRLTVTATCPMDLQLFPMDSQKCKLEIESYGYSITDIIYVFPKGQESISREAFELPQFVLADVKISNITEKLSSGTYSRLICYFLFKRSLGFYLLQVYIPSVLIVSISWVSFWLSREATPARVALGVTTVLTMTTLMTTTNSAMPKVSYVKSIDTFLGVSFMMVFCSLLEYAAIGYLSKRLKLCEIRKKSSVRSMLTSPAEPAIRSISVPAYFNTAYRPFYSSTDRKSTLFLDEHSRPKVSFMDSECDCPLLPPPPDENHSPRVEIIVTKHEFAKQSFEWRQLLRPSNIDKYSRIFFPTIYFTFNVGYWAHFVRLSRIASKLIELE